MLKARHESPDSGRDARARRRPLLLLLFAAAACLVALAAPAQSQSGRRKPAPLSPAPTPSPTPEAQGESESASGSRKASDADLLSFTVHRLDGGYSFLDFSVEESVVNAFVQRLTRSKGLSASRGDKLTRKEAQTRAKSGEHAYVVLLDIEEESWGGGVAGRTDTRTLVVKTYVYEPKTGVLKYVDRTAQRPYRQSATVGGVRLPLPSPRTIERYPNELQLEQAGRDAADRIMQRFSLRLPPD
jgi:hypothetical protein